MAPPSQELVLASVRHFMAGLDLEQALKLVEEYLDRR
jgi:hypothetical protein